MRRFTPLLLLLALLVLAACSPAITRADSGTQAEDLLSLINEYRRLQGLGEVSGDVRLARIARARADEMVQQDYFDPCAPGGQCLKERMQAAGYPARYWAEDIAVGYLRAEDLMRAWTRNAAHRQILLQPEIDAVGIDFSLRRLNGSYGVWVLLAADAI